MYTNYSKKTQKEVYLMKKFLVLILCILVVVSLGFNVSAIHEEIPAESQVVDAAGRTPVLTGTAPPDYSLQALINLLEKKDIITKKELREEIEKLRSQMP
jgi:hypothetical protein